jgi:hypothetical protein
MRLRIILFVAVIAMAGAARAAGLGNPRNDRLLAIPESERAQVLGKMLRRGCVGVEAFPMGVTASGRAKGYAYWSVRCQNGKSYAVQIPPSVKTPAVTVDCTVLRGTGHECFKKF